MLFNIFVHETSILFYIIGWISMLFVLVKEWRYPRKAVFWVAVLFAIPIVGFAFYLVLGQSRYRKYTLCLPEKDSEELRRIRAERNAGLETEFEGKEIADALGKIGSDLTYGNDVRLYTLGNPKFEDLMADLRAAKSHIHMEYYIIRDNDPLSMEIFELLGEKAKEGVEVRLIADWAGLKNNRVMVNSLRNSGAEVRIFNPLLPNLFSPRKNNRDHRKIADIDGETAYVGGFNIGVEYLGLGEFGYWRDSGARIRGPAVSEVIERFLMDWKYVSGEDLYGSPEYAYRSSPEGNVPVQIVSGGPDMDYHNQVAFQYLMMIGKARKTLHIHAPYFVPDETFSMALRGAAMRGVDVKVIIPDIQDHPLVYWANRRFADEVMKDGVKVYEYNGGFIHSKALVADGCICSVGSANLDDRSLKLNFETNAMIYSEEIGKMMEDAFQEDIARSTEYSREKFAEMSLKERMFTKIAWFLSGELRSWKYVKRRGRDRPDPRIPFSSEAEVPPDAFRFGEDGIRIESSASSVLQDQIALAENRLDVEAAARIDDVGHHVLREQRPEVRGSAVQDDDVRIFPGLQGAYGILHADGLGAVYGGEIQKLLGGRHGGIPSGRFLQEAEGLHLREHVEGVVGGAAVGPHGYVHAVFLELRDGSDASGGELHVGHRA